MTNECAPYDARAVANYVLDWGSRRKSFFTQLQVYKIVYFANGWYLTSYQRRLVQQDFEAWQYGPVVRVLRDSLRDYGKNIITGRAERLDIFTGEYLDAGTLPHNEDSKFVDSVIEHYHQISGWELSEMTHAQGSPWDNLWNSKTPIGRLGLKLKDEEITQHFSELGNLVSHH